MTINQKPTYLLGLDLGQKHDYTALSVLRQRQEAEGGYAYDLIRLDRWRGKSYSDVAAAVKQLLPALNQMAHQDMWDQCNQDPWWSGTVPKYTVSMPLIVDATGVGIAVVDSLRAADLDCIAVTIHGGDAVSGRGNEYRVPKRELVGTLQVLLQNRRLNLPDEIKNATILKGELENFRAKINLQTGHDTYGAGEDWRSGNHDDLVLSLGLAAWYGENHDPHGLDALRAYMDRQLGRG